MLRNALLMTVMLTLVGCNTLKRITSADHTDAASNTLPDDYVLAGATSVDFQIIQPVRCADSAVSVRVKRAGETAWRECNRYEVKIDTVGVGGGGVWFRRQAEIEGSILHITGKPVAPAGTQYEIRSVLTRRARELY